MIYIHFCKNRKTIWACPRLIHTQGCAQAGSGRPLQVLSVGTIAHKSSSLAKPAYCSLPSSPATASGLSATTPHAAAVHPSILVTLRCRHTDDAESEICPENNRLVFVKKNISRLMNYKKYLLLIK